MPMPERQERPAELLHAAAPEYQPPREHSVSLLNRQELTLTGVSRVLSYDESGAALATPLGNLTVGGQGLQVSELSVRTGQVHISGKIEYLQYSENRESSGGLLARLMR